MMMRLFKKNEKVILLLIAGGSSSLFQWLLICAMTKIFGVETVGVYSGAAAIITPIVTFANLSLRAMQVTDVDGFFNINNVFAVKKVTAILASVLSIVILIVRNSFVLGFFIIQAFVLSSKIANMMSDAAYGYLIRYSKLIKYTVSIVLISAGSLILFTLTGLVFRNVYISMAFYTIPYVFVFLIYDLPNVGGVKAWKAQLSKDDFISIARLCLPLAIVQTINTLYDSVPKLVLESNFGNSELGIFSAIAYVSLAGGLVVTAISTGYATELALLIKKERYRVYFFVVLKEVAAVSVVCAVFYSVFVIWGAPIISLLYTAEFVNYMDVILLLIIAMSLNFISRIFGTACTAAHYNNNQLATALICVSVLSILSVLLIPRYGIQAAAIIECCAYGLKIVILIGVLIWNLVICKNNKLI